MINSSLMDPVQAPDVVTSASSSTTVAVVLYADRLDHGLVEALLAVADQTTPADRVVVLDATPAGELTSALDRNEGLRAQLPATTIVRIPADTPLRAALPAAAADLDTDCVWVLTRHTRPEPDALRHLSLTFGGTRRVLMAGPKLLAAQPGRLQRFGIQSTRTGRLRLRPRPGEPDQQQYDDRLDALAVPIEGALVHRAGLAELGGFDKAFTGVAADLDLGWRGHLAGRRVALAPRARVVLDEPLPHPTPVRDRRAARRVAITRAPWWAALFLALWVALGAIVAGISLLLIKRPRAAARELADVATLLDPLRGIPPRWRARSLKGRGRRTMHGLFVPMVTVARQAGDRIPEFILPAQHPAPTPAADTAAGADPATEDSMGAPPEHTQAVRNPGLWAVLATTAVAFAAGQTIDGGLVAGLRDGFVGGQLTGASADASQLWHSWVDGWRGPGLGTADLGSSGLPVLALMTWLWDLMPFHDAGANPLGGLLGAVVVLAMPLAALSAYVSGRVVTRRRWARALAALAWACSPLAAAALGEGRLGAVAVLVLLPLMLAALQRLTSSPRAGSAAAAALPTALLATVVPGALILAVVAALALMIGGSGRTIRRSLAFVGVTALLTAPVLREVAANPERLLTGWGLLARPDSEPAPLTLALLHPSTTTGLAYWAAATIVALGLLALLRRGTPSGPAWFAGALIVTGLGAALVTSRLWIAQGDAELVTGWRGTGLLVALAGLLVAALHASDADLPPRTAWIPAVTGLLATAAIVGGTVLAGLPSGLAAGRDERPAVAIDAATGPASGRSVLVDVTRGSVAYTVMGREPALPAADLTDAATDVPDLTDAIAQLTDPAGAPPLGAVATLARWGIGFVVLPAPTPAAVEHRLDATDLLSRVGDYNRAAVWRVEPAAISATLVAPSRLRIERGNASELVPAMGAHAATAAAVHGGGTLVVAEPADWAKAAVVRADGARLTATVRAGQPTYALPAAATHLDISLPTPHPTLGWLYAALVALVVYAAIPLGSRRRPEAS